MILGKYNRSCRNLMSLAIGKGQYLRPMHIVPWWKLDKDKWPYQAPWGYKVFGAFQHARIRMPEDFSNGPSPFGHMRVNTPTRPKTGSHQLSSIKVNMPPEEWLEVTPHPSLWAEGMYEATLREMVRERPVTIVTESGSIILKSLRAGP